MTSDSVVYIKRNPVSGASGSPVFFPNGHVVGLFAGTFTNRYEKVGGGPKINILRELVAYHKLQALLPAFEVRAARQSNGGPDLCLEDLGTAVRLAQMPTSCEGRVTIVRQRKSAMKPGGSLRIMRAYLA